MQNEHSVYVFLIRKKYILIFYKKINDFLIVLLIYNHIYALLTKIIPKSFKVKFIDMADSSICRLNFFSFHFVTLSLSDSV